MRCVSLSVGIADYANEFFRRSENRLKYAAEDATAFHRYCSTGWAGADNRHALLRDREATESSLRALTTDLQGQDQIDLLMLYLSGHGERGAAGSRGWFCLADARPAVESMSGIVIDHFFATLGPRRAILIIDCCYAEAVVAGSRYFSSLTDDPASRGAARVFAASARSDQRSWEDNALRRSVFSDVLLRGLSTTGAKADPDGYVDYDARLVPLLREQVPLQVAARKRGLSQEPVFGGVAAVAIRLPTVTMASLGRELTVFETVRRRVIQLVVLLGAGLVLGVLAIDAVGYHLTTTGTGRIVVRPGLAETYQLLPFHLRPEVDTGLSLADVDPSHDEFLIDLSRSSVAGFAIHLDDQGLRPWFGAIEPFLRPQQQPPGRRWCEESNVRLIRSTFRPPSWRQLSWRHTAGFPPRKSESGCIRLSWRPRSSAFHRTRQR